MAAVIRRELWIERKGSGGWFQSIVLAAIAVACTYLHRSIAGFGYSRYTLNGDCSVQYWDCGKRLQPEQPMLNAHLFEL